MEDKEESQLIMMLEVMSLDIEGKAEWVGKAMDVLPSCPNNPELFALLGQEAYACGRFPESMLACKRALATRHATIECTTSGCLQICSDVDVGVFYSAKEFFLWAPYSVQWV